MRIVIDMQGAQSTGSRERGIGRYTLSLAQGIVRNREGHEVFLALSDLFPDSIESIRTLFNGLLPQENIRVWQVPGSVSGLSTENNWRRRTAELVREAFLTSLKPDIVLVSSLMEGLSDDAVTSIGALSSIIPTAVVLYDLIPLIYRDPYLENPVVEAWYEQKLDHLRRADLLLTISESSRQEAVRYLGFSSEAAVNISTAAERHFRPIQVAEDQAAAIRKLYSLRHSFVMYTGGIDHRKNIERLIRAYAKLPLSLRTSHQLVVVCSIQPASRTELEALAKEHGLEADEMVLTGFVPEQDLLTLYNLCKVFIFPSWHEGFGLPALEAMSCGRATIGANTSSLPEVIGRADALFDPLSESAITEKLALVLTDDAFRAELEQHGPVQAQCFSWDLSAQRAIEALEVLYAQKTQRAPAFSTLRRRPKLAYLSPLPPERSGISDYSAELLPELSRHYDIEVIVAQDFVSDVWIKANCPIRNVEWFRVHSDRYDRVIYHFGNSDFHKHMFSLLEDVPGVVVLHDFFLSGISAHMDHTGYQPSFWAQTLYQSHGYAAVQERFHASDIAEVIWRYPCNSSVLRDALGLVVHSENSRRLASQWYGAATADDWAVVPHLRVPAFGIDRVQARRKLKLKSDDFVVCSFGLLGPTKLSHRLLNAWLSSSLAQDAKCVLVFVGENHNGDYGAELVTSIVQSGLDARIRITGWAETGTFRSYLAAADLGVQLRTLSRGETSGTVLDCMNYGLPTVVNANGSMADLPDDGVWKLPDEFSDAELVVALETLWRDPYRRQQLGTRAREIILTNHSPRRCASQYAQAIETAYCAAPNNTRALNQALALVEPSSTEPKSWIPLAQAIALSIPPRLPTRQLLVDISELIQREAKNGIQRVMRGILKALLSKPPFGYRVEPVYASPQQGYRYARSFTLRILGCPPHDLVDDPVEYQSSDLFLGLDLNPPLALAQRGFYQQLRSLGVRVTFVICDLVPFRHQKDSPQEVATLHNAWLTVLAENDSALCISKTGADELTEWVRTNHSQHTRPVKIAWVSLCADLDVSNPSNELSDNANTVLGALINRPSFLMVGTVGPWKDHVQTLEAFETLWAQGIEVALVIIGRQGNIVEPLAERLQRNPELGKRLFWLEDISDAYLNIVYTASTCLIAASEGDGCRLHLMQAAQRNLAIIARDVPVLREVAGDKAFYFQGHDSLALADAIRDWLALNAKGLAPLPIGIPGPTWHQCAGKLLSRILPTAVSSSYVN